MFLQLGTYKFEGIKLPQNWGGNFATNYAQIPIVNGKPVVQKTGEKLVEYDIEALFSHEFCTPVEEVEALQLIRRNGVVNQLTGGDGTNYGKYVITELSIVNQHAADNGYVLTIKANLKLLEYNSTKTVTKQTGVAVSTVDPLPEEPLAPLVPLSGSIQNDLNTGIVAAAEINTEVQKQNISYHTVSNLVDKAVAAWEAADTKIQATKNIILRAVNLRTTIANAQLAAEAVKEAAEANSPEDLYAANTVLDRAVYEMKGASVPVIAFIGSREGGN